jgi:hypothetical protein
MIIYAESKQADGRSNAIHADTFTGNVVWVLVNEHSLVCFPSKYSDPQKIWV